MKYFLTLLSIFAVTFSFAQAPTFLVSPNPVNTTISNCGDSVSVPLTISNTGGGVLSWRALGGLSVISDGFESGTLNSFWTLSGGSISSSCGTSTGSGAISFVNFPGTRMLETSSMQVVNGIDLQFDLLISTGFSGCENADPGEEVVLEYTTNNFTWTQIGFYNTNAYPNFTTVNATVPSNVSSNNLRLRWRQLRYSGTGIDAWAIDNISIGGNSFQSISDVSPDTGDVVAGGNMQTFITVNAKNLTGGNYSEYLYFQTNDPAKPVDSVLINLNFLGTAQYSLGSGCINIPSIQESATVTDSVRIINTGCDTLDFTSITSNLNVYTILNPTLSVLPDDTSFVYIQFAPLSMGNYNGVITFNSNIAQQTKCIQGTALGSPVLSFSPTSVNRTITSCNDSLIIPIKIYNTGNGPLLTKLDYSTGSGGNSPISYFDDFESGSITGWNLRSGFGNLTLSNQNPASGSTSLSLTGNNDDMYEQLFSPATPDYLSVKMRTNDNGNSQYLYVGSGPSNINGLLSINRYGSNQYRFIAGSIQYYTVPNVSNWTHFELKNIDFGAKTFDVYANGTFLFQMIFRNTFITSVDRVTIGHYDNSLPAFFDDIQVGGRLVPEWASLNIDSVNVNQNDSATIQLKLNAIGLSNGAYNTSIYLRSNEPTRALDSIPVSFTVQGTPNLSASTNVINFGGVTQFTTRRDSFIVDNLGCDSLRITNVISSNSDFSISTNQAVIAPRTSLTFYVDFNPTLIGGYNDSIRIINNDAEEVIYFSGNSSGAPALLLSPRTYTDTTFNCVDSITVPIKVKNPGGSTLTANFGNVSNASLDSMLSNLLSNHANITSQIPNLYLFSNGFTGNNISDGGGDMYDGGNFLNTNLQTSIPYTNNAVLNSTAFGLSGEDYFTCKTPGLFVMVADLDNVSQFRITGNLGADGSGQVAANVINMTHNGVSYVGFTKSVHAAGDPSINHLMIVEQSVGATRTHLTTTSIEDHRINNLASANRIYYLLYSNGYSNVPLSNTVNQSIMTAFLDEVSKGGDFDISFTPPNVSVPAGDSITVNAKIIIQNQPTGWYDASAFVSSNDPLLPLDSINFDIYVSASPQINFASNCINFGSQFINTTTTDSLLAWNTGCDTLNISAVVALSGNFSTNQSNLRLAPGDSVYLRVTYTPTTIGNHNSFIRVFNNDADSTICLNAISTPAPIASVTPSSLTATVNFCDTVDQILNVSNIGGGLLRYSFGSSGNSGGTLEVLAITLGADMSREYPNTITAINSSFTNYNLTTFNTVNSFGSLDSNLFKQQLVGKDVVLIPELESSAPSYSTINPTLRRFVNNGGTVLFFGSGGNNARVIFNSGLFSGSFLNNQNSGILSMDQPSHPLLDSTTLPFTAESATMYYNILNPDTSLVLSLSGNPVIVTRNQGLGKVALIGFDYYNTNLNITQVAGNALRWAGSSGRLAPWIRIDRTEDSLSASNSHAVRVTFDASNLSAGLHTSDITIFTNDPLNPTITIPCSLTVLNTPCADFTFTKANNCTRTVSFSDNSSNGPTLFSWDFGDGNTSAMRNPTHTYQTAGTYTVTFIASNTTSSDTVIRTVNITSMTAAFNATGQRVVGQPINFSSSAVGATSYFWNFGNGQFSSAATPSMIYTNAGQYIVSLAVVNSQGCSAVNSDTLNILITGLDEQSVLESIQLYPNPSNGLFNLRYTGQHDINKLKLKDAEGRLIRTLSISEKTKEFNVSDLAPGVYHLQIEIEGYAPINKPLIIK